jgi:hypothetical protein
VQALTRRSTALQERRYGRLITTLGTMKLHSTTEIGWPIARLVETIRVAFLATTSGILLLVPSSALSAPEVSCNQQRVRPLRQVCGVVIDRSGSPIAGAKVTILKGAKEVAAAHTGSDGRFSFAGLEEGNYQVQTQAEGFHNLRFPVVPAKPLERPKRALEVVLITGGEQCSDVRLVKLKTVEQRSQSPR